MTLTSCSSAGSSCAGCFNLALTSTPLYNPDFAPYFPFSPYATPSAAIDRANLYQYLGAGALYAKNTAPPAGYFYDTSTGKKHTVALATIEFGTLANPAIPFSYGQEVLPASSDTSLTSQGFTVTQKTPTNYYQIQSPADPTTPSNALLYHTLVLAT